MEKNNLLALRRLHGAIYDWKVAQQQKRFEKNLLKKGYRLSKKREKESIDTEEDYPVDFVVPWVDGSDPAWLAQKEQYSVSNEAVQKSNSKARYRDWGIFQYWFRAVELYAPWVRTVYLITWGHVPSWLNEYAPKLKIIRHEDFIPNQFLPTFHVNPIELNMWRIPGLSEHFIYFNDDMFLMKPVKKSDFFCNGLPKYCGLSKPNRPHDFMTPFEHMLSNDVGIFNSNFNIRECMINHPEKWFSVRYGKDWDRNFVAYRDGYSAGFVFPHLGIPFRRSTMERFCELFPEKIEETCRGRFRQSNNINDQVFQLLEIYSGTYEPVSSSFYGIIRNVSRNNIDELIEAIQSGKYIMICMNDGEKITDEDFPFLKERLAIALDSVFPNKSSFEK